MSLETIILYVIIAAVLIVIPAVLAKKTGQNPVELLFGERASRMFSGKKDKKKEEKEEKAGKADAASKRETNSSRNDLMDLVSHLATIARKNHFRLIVPGVFMAGEETTVLTAVLITRSMAVGINCFGFGGTVQGEAGDAEWKQTLNGEKNSFPSPVFKNRKQRELLQKILADAGQGDVPVEIIGVFTSPSVRLSVSTKTNCYKKDAFYAYLQKDRFMADNGVDPGKVEKALEPYRKKS